MLHAYVHASVRLVSVNSHAPAFKTSTLEQLQNAAGTHRVADGEQDLTGRGGGGRGRKTATSPLVVRLLRKQQRAHLQNASSDRDGVGKNCDDHQVGMFLHHKTSVISPRILRKLRLPTRLGFCVSHDLFRPVGQFKKDLGGMTGAIILCFTETNFFFFFFPVTLLWLKSKLFSSSVKTNILLKGQENTHWDLFNLCCWSEHDKEHMSHHAALISPSDLEMCYKLIKERLYRKIEEKEKKKTAFHWVFHDLEHMDKKVCQ